MNKKIVLVVLLLGSLITLAHEGHDATPGATKANHGGTVKRGKEINLEYVVSGNTVKLFPASHDGKDLPQVDVKLLATAKLPKGKPESAKLEFKHGSYFMNVDFKSAYRLEVDVVAEVNGKKDNFKFQVEK